jgi:hypothetical protein
MILFFWAAATTWLVWHDVWPALTAGDPPEVGPASWAVSGPTTFQVGIFNKYDQRIGTAWTTYSPIGSSREDEVYLHWFPMPGPILVTIDLTFTEDGQLDEFDLAVRGGGLPFPQANGRAPIEIKGERFASVYGFTVTAGGINDIHETFKITTEEAGLIGNVFRPFAALPRLEVGQSWRMQVVNPVSVITGVGRRFVPMLVRVTGREMITTSDGRQVSCLVVEAPNVRAWVDDQGLVWEQKVELPIGGPITVRTEPFDREARLDTLEQFEDQKGSRSLIG